MNNLQIKNGQTKRMEWVDALRGFAIFCVTLCHLNGNYYVEKYVVSFNVFAFVFLSGLLHGGNQGNFKKYFVKKTKTVLLPFAMWNLVSIALEVAMGTGITEAIRLFFLLDGEICWNSPIYFLLVLYMTQIVYYFIAKYLKSIYWKLGLLPILIILSWLVSPNLIIMKINLVPLFLLFYLLGDIFAWLSSRLDGKFSKWILLPVGAVLLAASIIFGVWLNTRVSYTIASFGNIFYLMIAGAAGVLFYALLFKNVNFIGRSRVLRYFGNNTLIIMASQFWLIKIYPVIMSRVPVVGMYYFERNGIMATVVAIATMMIICVGAEIIKAIGRKLKFVKVICTAFGIR